MAELVAASRTRRWDSVLLWGFLGSLALIRAGHLEETDPYWQIRAGAENLAGVPLARPDTWSWSGVEGNWYPNSPLWNIILALAHSAGGLWGFFALSAITIVLLLVMVDVLGRRLGARSLPGLLGLLVVLAAAFPVLNARATLVVQLIVLVAVYAALLLSDRAAASLAPWGLATLVLAVAFGLSAVGNWVHLSFLVLGPVMAGVWAVIWLLTPGLTAGRRGALIVLGGIGWVAGTVITPYGIATGIARSLAVQEACQGLIAEWSSPLNPNVPATFLVMLAGALLLAGGTAWWLGRQWRAGTPSRDLVALALIGVPTALAGLVAIRFLGVSLLTLAPVAAAAATRVVDRLRARLRTSPASPLRARLQEYTSGRFWRIVLTATLVLLSPGVVFLGGQHGEPPERALVDRLPVDCRLFTRPGVGSAVVLLRPDVTVWMDGRADFFGRQMLVLGYAYFAGSAEDVVPVGATCVLLNTTTDAAGIGERIRAASEWRLETTQDGYELWLPAG